MNFKKKTATVIAGDEQEAPPIRSRISTAVLLSLGVIGASLSGEAGAVPMVPDTCGPSVSAQSSRVLDAVEGSGPFDYGFRVCNTSFDGFEGFPAIRDWELPFFGTDLDTDNEAGITAIEVPAGWEISLEEIGVSNGATGWDGVAEWQTDGNPMKDFFDAFFGGEANNPYNAHTHVLHFYTPFFEGEFFDCLFDPTICAGDSLEGFGFTSIFGPTNAPYQASWVFEPIQTGDPLFPLGGQPLSPTILQALQPTVPEPSTLALLAAGGLMMGAARRRRRKSQDDD